MISDPLVLTVVVFGIMFLFLFCGLWIGLALFAAGIAAMLLCDLTLPPTISIWYKIGGLAANCFWNSSNSIPLTAIPLFVFMGDLLQRAEISTRMLNGLGPWLSRIPGRLLHINVVACTLFAAISGSSAATTATIGKITLRELSQRGYDRKLAIGSLAGAGTLGFLIPPSMIMIVYGFLAEQSIGKLFISGIVPGLILAGLYAGYIAVVAVLKPQVVPPSKEVFTWAERFRSLRELGPVVGLITAILGSIYAGWATAPEAAAIGVIGSLLIALMYRKLTWPVFMAALRDAVKTTAMICFIILGASFLSQVVGFVGIARALSQYIAASHFSPYLLICMITILYLILGCLLDGISMVVMTLPIVLPIVQEAGFSLIWFGIYLVIMVEVSQITPPVGFSLFVIQAIADEDIGYVVKAALPFLAIMIGMVFLVTVFPHICTFLVERAL